MKTNEDYYRKAFETSSWPYHKYVNIGQSWFQQFGNDMKRNGDFFYRKVAVTSSCLAIIILTLVSHGSNSLGMS